MIVVAVQENAKLDESRVLAKLVAEDKDEGPNGLVRSVSLFLFPCLGLLTTGYCLPPTPPLAAAIKVVINMGK